MGDQFEEITLTGDDLEALNEQFHGIAIKIHNKEYVLEASVDKKDEELEIRGGGGGLSTYYDDRTFQMSLKPSESNTESSITSLTATFKRAYSVRSGSWSCERRGGVEASLRIETKSGKAYNFAGWYDINDFKFRLLGDFDAMASTKVSNDIQAAAWAAIQERERLEEEAQQQRKTAIKKDLKL